MKEKIKKNIKNIWKDRYLKSKEREPEFTTVSGKEIRPLYTPNDIAELDYDRGFGLPR